MTLENLLPIGRFSMVCRLSIKALRLYDELGLLQPAWVDPSSGYRYYRLDQAPLAAEIRLLRSLEMPLEEIKVFLNEREPAAARAHLHSHEVRLTARIEGYQSALHLLRQLIERKERAMEYDITIKEVPAQVIAAVRLTVPPAEIGQHFGREMGKIVSLLGRLGVACVGAPVCLYHSYDEESVDMEVGIPVSGTFAEGEGVHATELPAGSAAVTTHVGPYEQLGGAWEALMGWVQSHGHEQTGPCWESYTVDPGVVRDPAKFVTEVYCMVK